MTDADLRALVELDRWKTLARPGAFGEALFGKGVKRSGNCSCPYARAGGRVLGRLRRLGLAVRIDEGRTHGWQITRRGSIALADHQRGVAHADILALS